MTPYSLVGVGIPHVGYGRMTFELEKALHGKVEFRDDAGTVLFGMIPDMVKGWWEHQTTGVLTMWETDRLPRRFHRLCPMFDRILVPCNHNQELFSAVHRDVQVVPLGVDHTVWYPRRTVNNERFRFMTAGSGWLRKGVRQVIQAFRDADLPDSELVIKIKPATLDDPGVYDFGPNITVIKEELSFADEVDLHATADCFVSASRGEGYGLIPLQQAALGNLVIAPLHTGHLMFQDVIDWGLSSSPEPAQIMQYDDIGNWLVPDHGELVDAMRAAYQHGKPSFAERCHRATQTHRYSWENSARVLLQVHPPSGVVDRNVWRPAGENLIKVQAKRKVEADIGNHKIRISAGQQAFVPVSCLDALLWSDSVTEIL